MNDIIMTNDTEITTDIDTATLEDIQFMNELEAYVATLPQPSAEAVARYEANMTLLNSIREELGLNKVVVEVSEDDSVPYRGKYCDHSYAVRL